MFQNIPMDEYNNSIENEDFLRKEKFKNIIKTSFSKQNILIYIIAFMLSIVDFGAISVLFGLAIVAALASNLAPVGIVFLITCIGTGIGLGKEYLLIYILTSLIFFFSTLVFRKTLGEEYSNEKIKLGKNLIFSILIVQISRLIFTTFILYDLLAGIMMAFTTYVFYKIFAGSLSTIREFQDKKAFTIEEVIGSSLMLGIALVALKNVTVFGFNLMNILSIFIVLFLGWKNGVLVGTTAGATIGLVLGIINTSNPIMIATYTISGMISGILNKFGKIGVIVGFILGNAILSYVSSGNLEIIIHVREILIASIGLLAVPKNLNIELEDILPKKLYLPTAVGALEESKGTIDKLNTISETINDLAESYKEQDNENLEINEKNIEKFEFELDNNTQELKNNIIYDEIFKEEIIKELLVELIKSERIDYDSLIKILENNGSYIIGADKVVNEDVEKMVKAINNTYRINKIHFSYNKKINENKKNISNDLENVSKFISEIAEDLKKVETKTDIFAIEKEKIVTLLKQKSILVKNIDIQKETSGKTHILLNIDKSEECEGKCLNTVQKILQKVLEEKYVIEQYECGMKLENDNCNISFASEDNFKIEIGVSKKVKDGEKTSGDSIIQTKLKDGKYLFAISDGMGSGILARKSSQIAIKMLERLLSSGFNKKTSIDLINSTILNGKEETFATLDIAVLDLYKGNMELLKSGAMPTYIKREKEIINIKSNTLPTGITEKSDLDVFDIDVKTGDIIVMCSDGIVESNEEYTNKEMWVEHLLEQIETDNVQKIADILLSEAIDNGYGKAKDDMTVIVGKIK